MTPDTQKTLAGWIAHPDTVAVIVLQEEPQRVPGVRDYRILAMSSEEHLMFWRECAWKGEGTLEWWQVVKHAFGQLREPTP